MLWGRSERHFQSSSRAAQMSSRKIRKFSTWCQGMAVGKRIDRRLVGVWFSDIFQWEAEFQKRALTIPRTEAAVGVVVRSGKSGMACCRP